MVRDGLPAIVIAIAAAPPAEACCAQEERWHLLANLRDEVLGSSTAWIGDVDGDGMDDIAASVVLYDDAYPDLENPHEQDRVRILSGRDGTTLSEILGGYTTRFGIELAACSDHDGDGVADLIVAQLDDGTGKGKATIWSSRAGTQLGVITIPGVDYWNRVGLDTLPDSDGDGLREFVIGVPYADLGSGPFGVIQVRSSSDASLLAEWRGTQAKGFGGKPTFGTVPDLDKDGVDDLAMVEETIGSDGKHRFGVRAYSGRTYAELLRFTPLLDGSMGGICGGGDFNSDGWNDVVWVRNYFASSTWLHEVRVQSGKTGMLLGSAIDLGGTVNQIARIADFDADGHADLALCVDDALNSRSRLLVRSTKKANMPLIRAIDDPYSPGIYERFWLPRGTPRDVDGDGFPDVLHSLLPDLAWGAIIDSRVAVDSPAAGKLLFTAAPDQDRQLFLNAIVTGDLDGDGRSDLLVHEGDADIGGSPGDLVARSGADGAELYRVVDVAHPSDAHSLAALPDLDGDDLPDIAATREFDGIDVRSGRDGSLIAQLETTAGVFHDVRLAVLVDTTHRGANRRHRLAIGSKQWFGGPELIVLDLSTGARLWTIDEDNVGFATSVVAMGDVDGDGVADLACDAPSSYLPGVGFGRVVLLSGVDGHVIAERWGTISDRLGGALAVVDDLDGDGIAELLVGSPDDKPLGSMSLLRGADLAELRRWDATVPFGYGFGELVAVVPDSNGDGNQELLTTVKGGGWIECYSTDSSRRLATLLPMRRITYSPQLRTAAAWIRPDLDGDAQRTVVSVNLPADGLHVWTLPPLHLTLTPTSVAPDETITADVRGGPERSPMLLRLVAIDGVALDVVLVADALDRYGEWTVSDTAPPGLSGTTLAFRAATIGFDGRLAQSSIRELLFE